MSESTYSTLQHRLVGQTLSQGIKGIRLDPSQAMQVWKEWFPIRPCICVKEPCPCDPLDDVIVWLPENTPYEKTGEQREGADLMSFTVPSNAKLLVEAHIPMTVAAITKLKGFGDRGGHGGTIIKKESGKGVVGKLTAAFELGWLIGEKIDEETGASDEIADWLYDTFGPWPPWD